MAGMSMEVDSRYRSMPPHTEGDRFMVSRKGGDCISKSSEIGSMPATDRNDCMTRSSDSDFMSASYRSECMSESCESGFVSGPYENTALSKTSMGDDVIPKIDQQHMPAIAETNQLSAKDEVQDIKRSGKADKPKIHRDWPNFVDVKILEERYSCMHCLQVLYDPYQTSCGSRVCKACVDKMFGKKDHIPCPFIHKDEDQVEECQSSGLFKADIKKDYAVSRILSLVKCFCKNKQYDCPLILPLKKLKEHEEQCSFNPVACPNKGCPKYFANAFLNEHLKKCQYSDEVCHYCKQTFPRIEKENHLLNCDAAGTHCNRCGKPFTKRKMLMTHQQISPDCLTSAGRCYYHDYCGFKTSSISELQQHLREKKDEHLEALTLAFHSSTLSSSKSEQMIMENVKKVINSKVKPLEKSTATVSMQVKHIGNKLETSGTNGEALKNAMQTVTTTSEEVNNVKGRVVQIERQIKESGLDRVTVIESHSQSIRRNHELINDAEKRVRNMEMTSYDGSLIWKIKDYKRRKSDAVRGRQLSIYSQPFYTSRQGYKLCLRAYINGDGLGRGKCLSLFFVVMRGEYDDLLTFPFSQRVTFSLLCPKNPAMHKIESFLPDPDSSSFRRPQTEMNIASGCPQFAPNSLVESTNYLINDCIYIRVVVEPGGDKMN